MAPISLSSNSAEKFYSILVWGCRKVMREEETFLASTEFYVPPAHRTPRLSSCSLPSLGVRKQQASSDINGLKAASSPNGVEGTLLGSQTAATHTPHLPQKKPTVTELLPRRRPHQQNSGLAVFQRGPWQGRGNILTPPQRADFQRRIGISSLVWGRACCGVVLHLSPHEF